MEKNNTVMCNLISRKSEDGTDEVVMDFGDDYGYISFNDDDQENIKSLFNNILKDLVDRDITIKMNVPETEIKPTFIKDVAEEYVKQLNIELANVKTHLNERFNTKEES